MNVKVQLLFDFLVMQNWTSRDYSKEHSNLMTFHILKQIRGISEGITYIKTAATLLTSK